MNDNNIKSAIEQLHLSESSKNKIKSRCREYESRQNSGRNTIRVGFKVTIITALIAVMSIGVFAASELILFHIKKKDNTVIINAQIPSEIKDSDAPLRTWNSNSENGEISVRLGFEYLPEDLKESDNATHKYGGKESNRAITFTGFDLRRSDLNTVIKNIKCAQKFYAGDKKAYIISSDTVSTYNKDLYVLFEKEQIVVHGIVGYGINEDEIKQIAEGMYIYNTNDIDHALPISNETENISTDIPFIYTHENPKVYRQDLLKIGETGSHKNEFWQFEITVESFKTLNSINGFEKHIHKKDFANKFDDENGLLIPYKRTEILISGEIEKGEKPRKHFGNTDEAIKKFVIVTINAKCDNEDIEPIINTFSLGGLLEEEDGSIIRTQGRQNFCIDSTPGNNADFHEHIYFKNLGSGRFELGFLLDSDECENELYFYSHEAEIYYVLN